MLPTVVCRLLLLTYLLVAGVHAGKKTKKPDIIGALAEKSEAIINAVAARLAEKSEAIINAVAARLAEKSEAIINAINGRLDSKVAEIIGKIGACTEKSKTCAGGWTTFENSCYLFVNTSLTFDEAKSDCAGRGGYVVHVDSTSENNFIKATLRGYNAQPWWIGLRDAAKNNSWNYADNNENPKFTDWIPGQPSGGEYCSGFWHHNNFQWNDYSCYTRSYYICEK